MQTECACAVQMVRCDLCVDRLCNLRRQASRYRLSASGEADGLLPRTWPGYDGQP